MNWRKIGNDFVNKLKDGALEPFGWKCEKAGSAIFWIPKRNPITKKPIYAEGKPILLPMQKKEDLYHAFDLCAVSAEWPVTYWIQSTVGGSGAISARRAKVLEVAGNFHPGVHRLMLWSRHQVNKQLVRVELFNPHAKAWVDLKPINFRDDVAGLQESVEAAARFKDWTQGMNPAQFVAWNQKQEQSV